MGIIKQFNQLLALVFVISTLVLFGIVLVLRLGGDQALFLIIGHLAAWAEIVAIYFFRKKPPANST